MKHRPEYDLKIIGENLKRLREENGFSVDEVREYLRLGSVQAIYKYEQGKNYPQTDTMFALMELYNACLNDIIYCHEPELRAMQAPLDFPFSMVYRSEVLDETMEIEVINFAEYKAQCQRRCLEYARHYQHYLEQKSAS